LLQLPIHLKTHSKVKTGSDRQPGLSSEFANSIRQIIGAYASGKDATIKDIAELADMSVRTLQRRLADNELKFNDLLNQARYGHAKQKLQNSRLPVAEIAKSLGYSDPAHFTRAFRRWYGLSPTDFRRGL
jgi:AraC-like DNA-binding protein